MVQIAQPRPEMTNNAQALAFQGPVTQSDAADDVRNSQRTRALAQALREQSFQGSQANGGTVSWTQGLARLAQALVANTLGHRADVAEWDGNAKQQAARQSAHLGTTVTPNLAANPYRSRG